MIKPTISYKILGIIIPVIQSPKKYFQRVPLLTIALNKEDKESPRISMLICLKK
jgi:hypothetical protein